ncbi:DUF4332 domain-containing protein [Lunatibacter salilacus]|uniref:DUF4332 domain-containing protein n=1 Tax=Lunatibacter salilacus TaxID=2483804 RepID=UPI00131AF0A1|nr:DUF4332 domain-containing protein [Lunatibacter salilacus]
MKSQSDYMPDLSKIGLDDFQNELKTGRLLPSRMPLLTDIESNFSIIQKKGINNADRLREELKSSERLGKLAEETGISEDYLKLLKREVNNLLPTPIKFVDVPNISDEIIKQLNELDIVDTENLFPYVKDPENRQKLKNLSGISMADILWLTKLVDVSRIKWVGPKLARLIVDTEYDTVEKLSHADPEMVLHAFDEAKSKHKAYQGALGIDDIKSWIQQVVSKTPIIINY